MRRFVSGFCRVVVGLQVLIGVPLVVSIVFHTLAHSDEHGSLTVEAHVRRTDTPPEPAVETPPTNELPAVLTPRQEVEFAGILESRRERTSPLAGSLLQDQAGAANDLCDFVAALTRVAATGAGAEAPAWPVCAESVSSAHCVAGEHCVASEHRVSSPHCVDVEFVLCPEVCALAPLAVAGAPCCGCDHNSLEKSLQTAAEQLYAQADREETRRRFERADEIRQLARRVRREIDELDALRAMTHVLPPPSAEVAAHPPRPQE